MALRSGNTSIRPPAVAGLFYPADPAALRDEVEQLLTAAPAPAGIAPKALIAPHAGYVYSGGVAASAYKAIAARRDEIRRVVLLGPSHRVYFQGAAVPTARAFDSPLGEVPLDEEQVRELVERGDVLASDAPHAMEHSLEVHVPFLQTVLEHFTLIPIVTGSATPQYVARVLDTVWGDSHTLIVASSDLSHYLDYAQAQRVDAATSAQILARDATLQPEQACGALPINGLLTAATERGLQVHEIVRLSSGDTAGDRARVVGYGAFAIH